MSHRTAAATTAGAHDETHVHDLLGIGVGPFNLGLACLAEPLGVDAVFLERRGELRWHPGMMLDDAVLQVPFLADLVTMADPTSRYSFLSYLKQQGRLYPFYVRESFYPLRREFDDYCRWAADEVGTVVYHREAVSVSRSHDGTGPVYAVVCRDPRDGTSTTYRARRLVLGVGSAPHRPAALAGLHGAVWHSSDYLHVRDRLVGTDDVTVVGSGQSAAEIVSDLLAADTAGRQRLQWLTRSPRFFPLEYTKLTLELTSPEYSRHFRGLPPDQREDLLRAQAGLYKGISAPLVDQVHEQLYRRRLDPVPQPRLAACAEAVGGRTDATPGGPRHTLRLRQTETGEEYEVETSAVVLATGYQRSTPRFLDGVRDRLRLDDRGRLDARGDFSVDRDGGEVFVQNAEIHTHGFVAPDLGMGAWRNAAILERVLGEAPYAVEQRVMFQDFGVPEGARPVTPVAVAP